MPTLEWNQIVWEENYDWSQGGDEWSLVWGGALPQWRFTLLPRVQANLPAGTVLEIAPGFGRWTQFLKNHADRLIGVDFAAKCVATCRERFAGESHCEFHQNDGLTLPMVSDRSIDFAFSFDSLVHVDFTVLSSYLTELDRVLSPDGTAFLHHSNLATVVPPPKDRLATESKWHHRGTDVSADAVADALDRLGLVAIAQEQVNWGVTPDLTDCLTTLARKTSPHARERRVMANPGFMAEAERVRHLSELYTAG